MLLLILSSLHANLGSSHTNGSSHKGHSEGDVNMTTLTDRGERLLGYPPDSETVEVRLLSKTISHLRRPCSKASIISLVCAQYNTWKWKSGGKWRKSGLIHHVNIRGT